MRPLFSDTGSRESLPAGNVRIKTPLDKPPEHGDVGMRVFCSREVESHRLGISCHAVATDAGLKSRGSGDLWSAAGDEIQERVDMDAHAGEDLAEVWIDVDTWTYKIHWLVDVQDDRSLVERAREVFGL